MRLKTDHEKPTTIAELEACMLKEFVPPDEQSRAKVQLMELKMKGSMDKHVQKFESLIEVANVPTNEEYLLFFMSIPAKFKEKLSEKYPSGDPPTEGGMSTVYTDLRNWAISMKWAETEKTVTRDTVLEHSRTRKHHRDNSNQHKWNTNEEDNTLESWGPVKTGEKLIYIKSDRCMDCGKKGWSQRDHPCRLKKRIFTNVSKN